METKSLDRIEYDKIKTKLKNNINTPYGLPHVDELLPLNDESEIQKELSATDDGVSILRLRGEMPFAKITNIDAYLKRIKLGADLNGLEIYEINQVNRVAQEIKKFIELLIENKDDFIVVNKLVKQLHTFGNLTKQITENVAPDGSLADTASEKLNSIRRQIRNKQQQIRETIDDFDSQAKEANNQLTIRNDRYVVPVKAENKSKFAGIVHDRSSSGQTLFVEPERLVKLNNDLQTLKNAENEEESIILAQFTKDLQPLVPDIEENIDLLGLLDFINAKAKLAAEMKATLPVIGENEALNLKETFHPLIGKAKAIANNVTLDKDTQAIIITGPNTGGKTILLKTIGLASAMAQSGLFIAADENSSLPIFDNIFADIGDEQSLEQNLSTFSSHMKIVIGILENATNESLVLFDELGAGTDPQEGSALAISILDQLGVIGSTVFATTHYPELKSFGFNRMQTQNASMEFDNKTLQPTYRFLQGIPGKSNAFLISQRLGMDRSIIDNARNLIDESQHDLNDMISDLQTQKSDYETKSDEYKTQLQRLNELVRLSTNLYDEVEAKRQQAFNDYVYRLNSELKRKERTANDIIKELNQQKGNGNSYAAVTKQKAAMNNLFEDNNLKNNKILKRQQALKELKPGDEVKSSQYGQIGTIIKKISDEYFEVQFGVIKMKLPKDDLVKNIVNKAQTPKPRKRVNSTTTIRSNNVQASLDLRGKRYDVAMEMVDRFIDQSLLNNLGQVTIVHGKGTGALRQGVTDYLRSNRSVQNFGFAPPNAGGDGATIVELK